MEKKCNKENSLKSFEKKEKLIEVAQKVILEKGYINTSVQDITSELGIAKGSFYTHFKSKDELIIDIIKELGAYQKEALDKVLGLAKEMKLDFSFILDKFSDNFFYFDDHKISKALFLVSLAGNIDALSSEILVEVMKNKNQIIDFWSQIILINSEKLNIKESEANLYGVYIQELFQSTLRRIIMNGSGVFSIPHIEDIKGILESDETKVQIKFLKKIINNMIKGESNNG